MPTRSIELTGLDEPARQPAEPATRVADPPNPDVAQLDASTDGEVLDCLLDELMLCLRYHRNLFPERRVEKPVFLGGESRNLELCQHIAQTVGIGAQLGDPLARLVRTSDSSNASGVDLRRPQPGWAVPMGLCLGETNL